MATQRSCDVCGFYRQGQTHRYGLSRQILDPTKTRRGNNNAYKRVQNFGGIDMCDECWTRIAKPKQRPELRGRTGPKTEPVAIPVPESKTIHPWRAPGAGARSES